MTDKIREEFEAWHSNNGTYWTEGLIKQNGQYVNAIVHTSWMAWQAATQRQQERIQALEADAARYRLIRMSYVDSYIASGTGKALDDELDAAMKGQA